MKSKNIQSVNLLVALGVALSMFATLVLILRASIFHVHREEQLQCPIYVIGSDLLRQ